MALLVYVESIGCKLNQAERDQLAGRFVGAGHVLVDDPELADVCVVNTCAVTHVAARKSRQRFRHLRRVNPSACLVATGCATGLDEHELAADLIVGNDRKDALASVVERALVTKGREPAQARSAGSGAAALSPRAVVGRTRPLVKIQDGCDNNCTYCIVRVLRGRQRSRPRDEILAEVADLVEWGYHEIVLTGVHVGSYGRDTGDNLVGLVRAILAGSAPERLRLSSIEPWDLWPAFLDMWQDPRLCRHLHLPLQSGCDATLRRMNRHYTAAQFADLVDQARQAIPDLAVTTDVIAGFPGETDAEFAESSAFVGQVGFARVHVFPFSARPGTQAALMPGQVDPGVRRRRAQQLRDLGRRSGLAFQSRFIGRILPVLWETRLPDGRWSGLTDNYLRVFVKADADLSNTLRPVRLTQVLARGMQGELV